MAESKSVLSRVAGILEDVADAVGLTAKIGRDVSDLVEGSSKKQVVEELVGRGSEVSNSRRTRGPAARKLAGPDGDAAPALPPPAKKVARRRG